MHEDKNKSSYYLISFKLSGDKLKQYYETNLSTSPWKKIEGFLNKAGFSRTKDSEYISDWKMSIADAYQLLAKMIDQMPWIATSNDVFSMYAVEGEIKISDVIRQSNLLHGKIKKLIDNPPGHSRGLSSAQPPAAPSGSQRQPPAPSVPPAQQNPDTVTVSISELKECFEADVELQVTVKKSDLEKAKKQAEAKKQSNTKSEDSEKSKEPPEQNKPRSNRKPKR